MIIRASTRGQQNMLETHISVIARWTTWIVWHPVLPYALSLASWSALRLVPLVGADARVRCRRARDHHRQLSDRGTIVGSVIVVWQGFEDYVIKTAATAGRACDHRHNRWFSCGARCSGSSGRIAIPDGPPRSRSILANWWSSVDGVTPSAPRETDTRRTSVGVGR